jgi:hypothetical protein
MKPNTEGLALEKNCSCPGDREPDFNLQVLACGRLIVANAAARTSNTTAMSTIVLGLRQVSTARK